MARSDTVSLELAGFGGGWTDVTLDLSSAPLRMTRGFQSAEPDDLVAAPSTFTFGLRNDVKNSATTRGYYSPDFASCRSGFGLDIRVRWQVTANGTTYTRFLGWIEEIAPLAGIYDEQTVAITAASWLNRAATTSISALSQAIDLRGDQLLPLLVALVDHAPASTAYATTVDTYPYAFDDLTPQSSTVMDGIDSVAKSGFDRVWEKADGTLVLESRRTRQVYTAPVLAITDAAPSSSQPGLAATALPAARNRQSLVNRVQVTTNPRRVDGSTVTLYSLDLSTNPSFNAGVTTFDAPYQDPSQTAQAVAGVSMLISDGGAGSVVGTSGSLPTVDFTFWSGPNATGVDVTSSVTVTVVYGMNQATITVTNSLSSLVYPSLLQCRGRGLYAYSKAVGIATGSGSGRLLSMNCPYQTSPAFGQTSSSWHLAALSEVRTRLDQGVRLFIPATDEVTIDQLHALDISSPVSVSETVVGLSAGAFFINSEAEEVDVMGNTTMTYGLGLNSSAVGWRLGIAGFSELGHTTVLRGF